MKNAKLQSITSNLMVTDVDETVDYYKNILGFNLEMSVPRDDGKLQWAMVSRDEVAIMLHEKENFIEEVPELANVPLGGSFTLFVRMEGLDDYYEKIKALKNIEIFREPMTTFYGMKEFTIRDLNGYILTFAEPKEEEN
jgi:uncharacterized glyoxalase superfamily protein PhnB